MAAHSFQLKLFRRECVDASRFRHLGRLPVATPPGLVITTIGAMTAGALLAIASFLIEVPERVRVEGILMPDGKVLAVRATRAGIVSGLGVRHGDWVRRGQQLLGIGEQYRSSGERSRSAGRRESLRRELAILESELDDEIRQARSRGSLAEERRELTADKLDAAEKELSSRKRLLDVRTRRLERAGELLRRDAIGTERHDELREGALQARAAIHAARQTVAALRSQMLADQHHLETETAAPERLRMRYEARREGLLRQLDQLELAARETLTAPDGGIVAALLVRNGSAVLPGQLLLKVADPEKRLEAYMYLGPDLAGRVSVGQPVELQLHSYPYQRYGTLKGTVRFVAGVPVPSSSTGIALKRAGDVYEVRAEIDPAARDGFAQWQSLPHGTSFSADVIRMRWPLYRWAVRVLTRSA